MGILKCWERLVSVRRSVTVKPSGSMHSWRTRKLVEGSHLTSPGDFREDRNYLLRAFGSAFTAAAELGENPPSESG